MPVLAGSARYCLAQPPTAHIQHAMCNWAALLERKDAKGCCPGPYIWGCLIPRLGAEALLPKGWGEGA